MGVGIMSNSQATAHGFSYSSQNANASGNRIAHFSGERSLPRGSFGLVAAYQVGHVLL